MFAVTRQQTKGVSVAWVVFLISQDGGGGGHPLVAPDIGSAHYDCAGEGTSTRHLPYVGVDGKCCCRAAVNILHSRRRRAKEDNLLLRQVLGDTSSRVGDNTKRFSCAGGNNKRCSREAANERHFPQHEAAGKRAGK